MSVSQSKFLSHPAATAMALFHHVWPVGMGATFGQVIAQTEQWRAPWLAAILTGAAVQIAIAIFRSWFNERRDLLHTMKEMLGEQRLAAQQLLKNEKEERHAMANRAAKAELKLNLIRAGVPLSRLPEPAPLYPEAERKENNVDGSDS